MNIRVLLSLCLGLCWSANLWAYNATGHKVVASICYRQLNASQRLEIIELLKKHPRYNDDFRDVMPDNVKNGDAETQGEWLFQQAAVWPDMARSGPPARTAFHRARWHYVNVPVFLSVDDQDELEDQVDVNLSTDPGSDFDSGALNVIQAIKNSKRILHGNAQTDAQKAVHICWILHCAGDIHQPLHAVAMYSQKLFPRNDQGGNLVKCTPQRNLHSAWDAALGTSDSFKNCRDLATELLGGSSAAALISSAQASSDPVVWRDEQVEIAKTDVYNHEVIVQLQSLEDADDDINHNPIQLSENYLRNRRNVANVLVVKAGARAAVILLDDPTTPLAINRSLAAGRAGRDFQDNEAILQELRRLNEKMDQIIEAVKALQEDHQ